MPIRLKCSCGKVLSVRDELAGKGVKCPGCQAAIRVPAAAAAGKSAAGKSAPSAAPAKGAASANRVPPSKPTAPIDSSASTAAGSLDDLFNEAGFEVRTGKTCPDCFASLAGDAVLCTQCGLHLATGDKLKAHTSEFEDEQSGEAYLKRAAADMHRSKEMQEKMVRGAGLPWWMLGLILFLLGSATGVAVISVNMAKRGESGSFDAVSTLLLLAGIATSAVGIGAYAVVIYRACMESVKQGLLVLFLPLYILFYGVTRFRKVGMTLLVAIVAGGAAAGLFVAAAANSS